MLGSFNVATGTRGDNIRPRKGVKVMHIRRIAVTKKIQRLGSPVPNCDMFIPKNDVTKFNGMEINASLVSRATLVAVCVDFLASDN